MLVYGIPGDVFRLLGFIDFACGHVRTRAGFWLTEDGFIIICFCAA